MNGDSGPSDVPLILFSGMGADASVFLPQTLAFPNLTVGCLQAMATIWHRTVREWLPLSGPSSPASSVVHHSVGSLHWK